MKAGWFKKAKKKFIRKRVNNFSFLEGRSGTIYRDWEYKMHPSGYTLRTRYISDDDTQLIKQIRNMGFVKAFLVTRKLSQQNPDKYTWWYNKKIAKIKLDT